jgi:hypothetical protein
MIGGLLHVCKMSNGVAFEASLHAGPGVPTAERVLGDAGALLTFLQEHQASAVYETGHWLSLSAPEIVERCRALSSGDGAVTVSVHYA